MISFHLATNSQTILLVSPWLSLLFKHKFPHSLDFSVLFIFKNILKFNDPTTKFKRDISDEEKKIRKNKMMIQNAQIKLQGKASKEDRQLHRKVFELRDGGGGALSKWSKTLRQGSVRRGSGD